MPPRKKKRPRGRPRKANNAFGKWIDAQGMTREQVATRLRLQRRYVDRLCRNERRPDLELAVRIEDLTKGEIPPRYWLRVPKHTSD